PCSLIGQSPPRPSPSTQALAATRCTNAVGSSPLCLRGPFKRQRRIYRVAQGQLPLPPWVSRVSQLRNPRAHSDFPSKQRLHLTWQGYWTLTTSSNASDYEDQPPQRGMDNHAHPICARSSAPARRPGRGTAQRKRGGYHEQAPGQGQGYDPPSEG